MMGKLTRKAARAEKQNKKKMMKKLARRALQDRRVLSLEHLHRRLGRVAVAALYRARDSDSTF